MTPIPITILTGFLGSGKTTLLNHIIRNSRGRNIAIVENEFGSVGIDSDLIEKTDQEIVEINDGCICCVVRKDFFSAIERLLDSNKKLDHIIIEASGLSDPIPVAQSFLMQDMDGRVVLDSIICLVDAPMFFNRQTQDLKILTDQLEFADFIVLNKMDQVEKSSLNQITDMIRRVNIYAPIISTTHGEIDMRYIFNTERFSVTSELSDALASRWESHVHDSTITQFVYTSSKRFDPYALKDFVDGLSQDVFRIKWFVAIEGHGTFILQKAGARMTLDKASEEHSIEPQNQVVFIGRWMDEGKMRALLDACTTEPSALFYKPPHA